MSQGIRHAVSRARPVPDAHRVLQPGRWLFAAAFIALGITGLVNGDFALVWQNVPADLPGRTVLAYICAIVELGTGVGLGLPSAVTLASRIVFPYMVLWMLLLVIPRVITAPLDADAWGGIGEIGAMTAGAWALFATHGATGGIARFRLAAGLSGIRGSRWLLIVALACLGEEVIVDALAAGDHVMQPWLQPLPWPAGWAILTGAGSIATCLALLFGIWPRLAATLEAAMVALIALVYWAPVLYTGRTASTAFIITILVAAGIWVVADTYRATAPDAAGAPRSSAGSQSNPGIAA